MKKIVTFIDLFAGMGGFRTGFELSCKENKLLPKCVFSSEIKDHARTVYLSNFENSELSGDITKIESSQIPDFDILLAGFPCQAFSNAGLRHGFSDTRGTLFFEVERILRDKSPPAFILENVEGLVSHNKINSADSIGLTLSIILEKLDLIGYKVTWRVLNAKDFGLAQSRKRIFIVGTKKHLINLDNFPVKLSTIKNILQSGLPVLENKLSKLLLTHFTLPQLYGKSVKDKRGGKNNIHSWDIELKGSVSEDQKDLLELILRARRNKKWGERKGIVWMDGMPLTANEIRTFYEHPKLQDLLDDLTFKKYLKYEHPKDIICEQHEGKLKKVRKHRTDLEKGYNIVAGKLSYEINKILDPTDIAPTLVATDLDRVVVPDEDGIRCLTQVEQCRLFGFADNFKLPISVKLSHDLFGNTVPVPVVIAVTNRLLQKIFFGIEPTADQVNQYANSQESQNPQWCLDLGSKNSK